MIMRWLVIVSVIVGCSKPAAPELAIATFGNFQRVWHWVDEACGYSQRQTLLIDDPSLLSGTDMIREFHCLALGPLTDVHIQVRGLEQACGLRIGPSAMSQKFDPKQLLPLFTDPALGERVVAVLASGKPAIVDGLFVGMKQDLTGFTSFALVIDGCGHRPIDPARSSGPHMY
jgi:hypothetical protein